MGPGLTVIGGEVTTRKQARSASIYELLWSMFLRPHRSVTDQHQRRVLALVAFWNLVSSPLGPLLGALQVMAGEGHRVSVIWVLIAPLASLCIPIPWDDCGAHVQVDGPVQARVQPGPGLHAHGCLCTRGLDLARVGLAEAKACGIPAPLDLCPAHARQHVYVPAARVPLQRGQPGPEVREVRELLILEYASAVAAGLDAHALERRELTAQVGPCRPVSEATRTCVEASPQLEDRMRRDRPTQLRGGAGRAIVSMCGCEQHDDDWEHRSSGAPPT
jgi:hypothetical protein